MPHDKLAAAEFSEEEVQAQVLQQPSLRGGDEIWQAEIDIANGTADYFGRVRKFTIRGPPRKSQELANKDAEQLTAASPEGPKAVRALANKLHHVT